TLQEYYRKSPEQAQKRLEDLRATMAQWEKDRPADEARMKEVREKIAEMEKLYTPEREREVEKTIAEMQKVDVDRKARVIYHVEPEYTPDAREKKIEGTVVLTLTIDHEGLPQNIQVKKSLYPSLDQSAIEAARRMRFEPAIKNGQPVSVFISVEFNFAVESHSKQELEEIEKRAAEARATQGESSVREMKMRRELTEQPGRTERARDLTRGAVLSMDRAIQIATSLVPGKVLACSLGRDGDKIFYHVIIIGGDGDKSTTTYVWVSALDGQVLKTEKEEPRKEEASTELAPRAQISGGVLNGKAVSLPQPEFPAIARSARASGEVTVQVTVDETGNVIAAHAVSGHPLLQAAAVRAARQASFSATRLNGEPVKVSGVLVYNFVAQ
ncbi:MAG: periplasmic protein TonB, partial [Blastocatellia bacterium]|nr:periplasmic protein TonB [Blastocatellia bacterium]